MISTNFIIRVYMHPLKGSPINIKHGDADKRITDNIMKIDFFFLFRLISGQDLSMESINNFRVDWFSGHFWIEWADLLDPAGHQAQGPPQEQMYRSRSLSRLSEWGFPFHAGLPPQIIYTHKVEIASIFYISIFEFFEVGTPSQFTITWSSSALTLTLVPQWIKPP